MIQAALWHRTNCGATAAAAERKPKDCQSLVSITDNVQTEDEVNVFGPFLSQ